MIYFHTADSTNLARLALATGVFCCFAACAPPSTPAPSMNNNPGSNGNTSNTSSVSVQLLSLYGPSGVKTTQDLYVKNYSDGSFVKKTTVAYGDVATIDVPVSLLGDVTVYTFDTNVTPASSTAFNRSLSADSYDATTRPGPFTIIYAESRSSFTTSPTFKKFWDKEDVFKPATGKAAFIYLDYHEGLAFPTGLDVGIEGGACFDPNSALNEELLAVDPGTRTLVVYNAESMTNCTGPVVAKTAPVTMSAGETYLAVPAGETLGELTLKSLKLRR